jgi:hypothetical protein
MDVSALFTEKEIASLLGHANDADTDPHLQFQTQLLEVHLRQSIIMYRLHAFTFRLTTPQMTLRLESSEKQDMLTRLFASVTFHSTIYLTPH